MGSGVACESGRWMPRAGVGSAELVCAGGRYVKDSRFAALSCPGWLAAVKGAGRAATEVGDCHCPGSVEESDEIDLALFAPPPEAMGKQSSAVLRRTGVSCWQAALMRAQWGGWQTFTTFHSALMVENQDGQQRSHISDLGLEGAAPYRSPRAGSRHDAAPARHKPPCSGPQAHSGFVLRMSLKP